LQQIKRLENVAELFGAQAVAFRLAERRHIGAINFNPTGIGTQNAGD